MQVLRKEIHKIYSLSGIIANFAKEIKVQQKLNISKIKEVLKAKDKPVEVWSVEADLGVSLEELQASSGAQRIGMQGIKVERKQIVLKGMSPQEAAEQLIALLEEEEVLNHG